MTAAVFQGPLLAEKVEPSSDTARPWHYIKFDIGLAIVITITAVAVLAGVIAPHSPYSIDVPMQLRGPSWQHIVGTDQIGRDTFSRSIYAARVSLTVAGISVLIGGSFGIAIGAVSAWSGGITDMLLMRFMDILYSFPAILLALAIMGGLGTSVVNAMIAVGIIFVPGFARLARAASMVVMKNQFIDAARAIGMKPTAILVGEILPNIMPPLLVQITQSLAFAIIVESALSFIGLGTQAPDPSWGNMLDVGRGFMQRDVWMALTPGLAIFVTVLGFNMLGDGLRDFYDPRLRS